MKTEKEITEQFPSLFKGSIGGFGVGDGWLPLILKTCEHLDKQRDHCPNIRFVQIKEKFGALRMYIDGVFGASDSVIQDIDKFINDIEFQSTSICENCGSTENVITSASGGYWIKSYCPKCHAERAQGPSDIEKATKLLDEIEKNLEKEEKKP